MCLCEYLVVRALVMYMCVWVFVFVSVNESECMRVCAIVRLRFVQCEGREKRRENGALLL